MLRYDNFKYITIKEGDHFGVMDLAIQIEGLKSDDPNKVVKKEDFLSVTRKFSVQA